jgi:hypothetical protein
VARATADERTAEYAGLHFSNVKLALVAEMTWGVAATKVEFKE